MNKPDTLVVTPTLGKRRTIERTIKNVRKIGGNRVKHVIVGPSAIKHEILSNFPNIDFLSEPKNCKGIYEAINFGLNCHAKNFKYLTYINDDDYWLKDFENLFKHLDNDDSIDIVYGNTLIVDEKNMPLKIAGCSKYYRSFKALLENNIPLFTQQSTLIKSKLFIETGGFDENLKLVSDSYFWLQLIENNKSLKYVNSLCAAYTFQDNQLSSDRDLQKKEHKLVLSRFQKSSRFISFLEVLRFRILNLRNYATRAKVKQKGARIFF